MIDFKKFDREIPSIIKKSKLVRESVDRFLSKLCLEDEKK